MLFVLYFGHYRAAHNIENPLFITSHLGLTMYQAVDTFKSESPTLFNQNNCVMIVYHSIP